MRKQRSVSEDAITDIAFEVCKILSAVATQCEHAKMHLGYPGIAFDVKAEAEAKTLVASMLEALADELPLDPKLAVQWASDRELTDHQVECIGERVGDAAKAMILEAAKEAAK